MFYLYLKYISLVILVDQLCHLIVPRGKISHGLWIGFYNCSQPLSHRTFRTLPISSTGSGSYHYYLWGTLLVTPDVSSLYTNIPHNEHRRAYKEFLNLRDHLVLSNADLCHLIRLILTMNSFSLNGNCYLQTHGTSMGTWMAPSFANLFMGKLEREFL